MRVLFLAFKYIFSLYSIVYDSYKDLGLSAHPSIPQFPDKRVRACLQIFFKVCG